MRRRPPAAPGFATAASVAAGSAAAAVVDITSDDDEQHQQHQHQGQRQGEDDNEVVEVTEDEEVGEEEMDRAAPAAPSSAPAFAPPPAPAPAPSSRKARFVPHLSGSEGTSSGGGGKGGSGGDTAGMSALERLRLRNIAENRRMFAEMGLEDEKARTFGRPRGGGGGGSGGGSGGARRASALAGEARRSSGRLASMRPLSAREQLRGYEPRFQAYYAAALPHALWDGAYEVLLQLDRPDGGGDDDDDDDDDDDGGGGGGGGSGGGGGGLDGWSVDMLRFLQGEEGGGKEGAGKDGGGEEGGEESGEEGGEEGGGFLCAFAWVVEPTVRCVGVAFYRHHPGVVRRTELARVAVARGEPVRAVPCRRLQPCVGGCNLVYGRLHPCVW